MCFYVLPLDTDILPLFSSVLLNFPPRLKNVDYNKIPPTITKLPTTTLQDLTKVDPEEVTALAGDLETDAAAVKEGVEAEAKMGEGRDESVAILVVDVIEAEEATEVIEVGVEIKGVEAEESVG